MQALDNELMNLFSKKRNLDTNSRSYDSELDKVNREIIRLIDIKRQLIIREIEDNPEGLYDKYTVINNVTGNTENGVFVLNPKKDLSARVALKAYCEHTSNKVLAHEIEQWLKEFEDYRCLSPKRGICDRTGSPVCCCYCYNRNQCYDEGYANMCNYVRLGDVNDIEDCNEKEGL